MELILKTLAGSQSCLLSSTLIIKYIDRITAHLNSHCFGFGKVWLQIQAPAFTAGTLIVEIVYFKKKMSWGLLFTVCS